MGSLSWVRTRPSNGRRLVAAEDGLRCGWPRPLRAWGPHSAALSVGGDRLEFGGEAVDAAVELVLGLDRLGGREVGAAVLEDAVQHGPRGDVIRLRRGVAVVGLVEGDVRDVGVAAAGHRDVEVLPRRRRRHDDVRRVDGDALGTMRGDGVPEVEVLGDVLRREDGASPDAAVRGA